MVSIANASQLISASADEPSSYVLNAPDIQFVNGRVLDVASNVNADEPAHQTPVHPSPFRPYFNDDERSESSTRSEEEDDESQDPTFELHN